MRLVRVATFNIRTGRARDGANHWDRRRELVARQIEMLDAGVVCLQEAQDFQVDELGRALPGYAIAGGGRRGGRRGEHVPVLWRRDRFEQVRTADFWLSQRPDTRGSVGWDAALPRICTSVVLDGDAGRFAVFNTHFDHRGAVARTEGARLLAARATAAGLPAILAGDLNAGPDTEPLRLLHEAGFRDAYGAAPPAGSGPPGTFHGFSGTAMGGRIDYVLHDPSWRAVSCEIVDWSSQDARWPSDHFPVRAELERIDSPAAV